MLSATAQKRLFFSVMLGIYLLSWWLQRTLLFNSDVSWLMLAAKRLLAGGTYTNDFFEINPPPTLYLYAPAVVIAELYHLPADIALRVYVYLLASLSLLLCGSLIKASSCPRTLASSNTLDSSQRSWLPALASMTVITLAIVFLFTPLGEFGQREHLMLILIMPYVFLMANRRQPSTQHSTLYYVLIGVMAGCGFVIKPYFLATLVLLECYYMRQTRRGLAWLRPEILSIFAVFFFCAGAIFILNRDYLTLVVPLVTHFYYQKYGLSLGRLFLNAQTVFAYYTLLLYRLSYKNNPHKPLCTVLAITTVGLLVAFFLQQTTWYYHTLPFFALSVLLCAILLGTWVTQPSRSKQDDIRIGWLTAAIFCYYLWHLNYIWLGIYFYAAGYFGLFALIFGFLFYIAYRHENRAHALIAFSITLLSGLFFRAYLLHSPLQTHLFLLTTTLLLLVFVLFIPQKSTAAKMRFSYFAWVGIVFFAYPCYEIAYVYTYSTAYKKLYSNLLTALNAYPNKSIYIFSNSADFAFPAFDYTQQQFASRFGCLGWLPPLTYWEPDTAYRDAYQSHKTSMDFFTQAVVDDLNKNQPDLIFVDIRNTNINHIKTYFGNSQIDYLRFFLQNNAFQTTWKNYHYVKTVDGQPLFKFLVYERNG